MISAFGIIIIVNDAYDNDESQRSVVALFFMEPERDLTYFARLRFTTLHVAYINSQLYCMYLPSIPAIIVRKNVDLFIRRFQFTGDDQYLPAL